MNKLVIDGVTKTFGHTTALNNVSLTLESDKIYGLLGRNGAGKSTLLNILTNRLFADSGSVTLNGENIVENDKVLRQIYLMSEATLYPEGMKIKDMLRYTGMFYPNFSQEAALKTADAFALNINKKVSGLSTGYKSIFKIVIAMSVNTPFVFFDEPVLGLDANHRELFYRLLLEKYSDNPFTAVLSTHLIEEAANLLEEVIIIKDGKIIRQDSKDSLTSKGYTVSGNAGLVDKYLQGRETIGTQSLGGLKTAYLLGKPDMAALPNGLEISGLDLQQLFIQLTNS